METSYFTTLVQNTQNESNARTALPRVVPGIVYTAWAPAQGRGTAPSAKCKARKEEKSLTLLNASPKYPTFLYSSLAVCAPRNG